MASSPKTRRPNLVADAADVLDLQDRHGRRLAALGAFGRLRAPTPAERKKFGIPPNARVIIDMGVVQRLKRRREREGVVAVLRDLRQKAARRRRSAK